MESCLIVYHAPILPTVLPPGYIDLEQESFAEAISVFYESLKVRIRLLREKTDTKPTSKMFLISPSFSFSDPKVATRGRQ